MLQPNQPTKGGSQVAIQEPNALWYWKLPFTVDFTIKNCDFPYLCKRLPEGIQQHDNRFFWWWNCCHRKEFVTWWIKCSLSRRGWHVRIDYMYDEWKQLKTECSSMWHDVTITIKTKRKALWPCDVKTINAKLVEFQGGHHPRERSNSNKTLHGQDARRFCFGRTTWGVQVIRWELGYGYGISHSKQ